MNSIMQQRKITAKKQLPGAGFFKWQNTGMAPLHFAGFEQSKTVINKVILRILRRGI